AQYAIWSTEGLACQRARGPGRRHADFWHNHSRSALERLALHRRARGGQGRRSACGRPQPIWQPLRQLCARSGAVDRISLMKPIQRSPRPEDFIWASGIEDTFAPLKIKKMFFRELADRLRAVGFEFEEFLD